MRPGAILSYTVWLWAVTGDFSLSKLSNLLSHEDSVTEVLTEQYHSFFRRIHYLSTRSPTTNFLCLQRDCVLQALFSIIQCRRNGMNPLSSWRPHFVQWNGHRPSSLLSKRSTSNGTRPWAAPRKTSFITPGTVSTRICYILRRDGSLSQLSGWRDHRAVESVCDSV